VVDQRAVDLKVVGLDVVAQEGGVVEAETLIIG